MQVDQFESEVESLSVQTRKKKGDKEVSVFSSAIHSSCRAVWSVPPGPSSLFIADTDRPVSWPSASQPSSLFFYVLSSLCWRGRAQCPPLIFCIWLTRITSLTASFTFSLASSPGASFIERAVWLYPRRLGGHFKERESLCISCPQCWKNASFVMWLEIFAAGPFWRGDHFLCCWLVFVLRTFYKWDPEEFISVCCLCS